MIASVRWRYPVLILFGLTLGVGSAELSLRILAASGFPTASRLAQWDPLNIQIEPHGELGYRQRPNAAFHYADGTVAHSNAQGFRGETVPIPKPSDLFRVVLLGGSATHGWGVADNETIDTHLRAVLQERYPGRPVDVVNLAFDAYDAYQLYERLVSDGIPLQPDVLVVNTGINDVRNAKIPNLIDRDPRTLIWEGSLARLRSEGGGGPSLWTRLKHYSYVFRLPGFIRAQARRRGAAVAARQREPNPEAITQFMVNIARIDSVAAAHGIAVLYSSPPSALKWLSFWRKYRVSYWLANAETTQAYRDSMAHRLAAFAEDRTAEGASVRYVTHALDSAMFLDDVHLTSAGNYQMALDFAEPIYQLLDARRAESSLSSQGTTP